MSAVVKLGSKLPGDENINGLDAQAEELAADPSTIRVGVVYYDVAKTVHETDADVEIPTVRIRRFEPVGTVGDAPQALRDLVDAALEERTGRKALPFQSVSVVADELPEAD